MTVKIFFFTGKIEVFYNIDYIYRYGGKKSS